MLPLDMLSISVGDYKIKVQLKQDNIQMANNKGINENNNVNEPSSTASVPGTIHQPKTDSKSNVSDKKHHKNR